MSTNAIISGLPKNLHIDDLSILKEPTPKVVVDPILFLFPPISVQKTVPVLKFNSPGESLSEVSIDSRVFGVALRKDIVHEVIRFHRHKLRQPKKTKRMGEIRGSNKKPRPQKGGGQGQVGHRRNSAWRGGQKAHGPVLRDYSIGMNRKVIAKGMMIALAAKLREGNLVVVDSLAVDSIKTKEVASLITEHGLADSTALFSDCEMDVNFLTATGNMPKVMTLKQEDLNVYDVVKKEKLVITTAALRALEDRLITLYTHQGKKRALLRNLAEFEAVAKKYEHIVANSDN